MPGDSHVTAMEAIKDEFGLRTSAATTPGLLKVIFVAMASRKIRSTKTSWAWYCPRGTEKKTEQETIEYDVEKTREDEDDGRRL